MTPASNTLQIFRGSKYDLVLKFYVPGTTTVIDLTGLDPFVMEIRRKAESPLLLSLTYAAVDLANGQIQFTATAVQTLTLPKPPSDKPLLVRYGIRDAVNNPYAEGVMEIHPFTPEPA
jgi:hypothetical protein